MADCQFAALPSSPTYKLAQLHWHASPFEQLLEKLGIDWEKAKAEFEAYLEEVKAGRIETLDDPKLKITSGPGYVKPPAALAARADGWSRRMNPPTLIVGGGPAGSAAHALAATGRPVALVDKADRLGGAPILSGYARLVPSGEWARDAIGGMVNASNDDNVAYASTTPSTPLPAGPGRSTPPFPTARRSRRGPPSSPPASPILIRSTNPSGASALIRTWSPPPRSSR